jgi:hypothetical protein
MVAITQKNSRGILRLLFTKVQKLFQTDIVSAEIETMDSLVFYSTVVTDYQLSDLLVEIYDENNIGKTSFFDNVLLFLKILVLLMMKMDSTLIRMKTTISLRNSTFKWCI